MERAKISARKNDLARAESTPRILRLKKPRFDPEELDKELCTGPEFYSIHFDREPRNGEERFGRA